MAGCHLVGKDAERPDVDLFRVGVALDYLRRHPARSTLLRVALGVLFREVHGEAHVCNLDLASELDEHVVGLDIPMQHVLVVEGLERLSHAVQRILYEAFSVVSLSVHDYLGQLTGLHHFKDDPQSVSEVVGVDALDNVVALDAAHAPYLINQFLLGLLRIGCHELQGIVQTIGLPEHLEYLGLSAAADLIDDFVVEGRVLLFDRGRRDNLPRYDVFSLQGVAREAQYTVTIIHSPSATWASIEATLHHLLFQILNRLSQAYQWVALLFLNVVHLVEQVSEVVRQAAPFDRLVADLQEFYSQLVVQVVVVPELELVVADRGHLKVCRLESRPLRVVKVELSSNLGQFGIVAVSDLCLLLYTFDAELIEKVWIEDKLVGRSIERDSCDSD